MFQDGRKRRERRDETSWTWSRESSTGELTMERRKTVRESLRGKRGNGDT